MGAFDALNGAIVGSLGTDVTYVPSTGIDQMGTQSTRRVIIGDTRELDDNLRGTYQQLFGQLADFPESPKAGDQFILDDGSTYMVQRVDIDSVGGIQMLCRLKYRAV